MHLLRWISASAKTSIQGHGEWLISMREDRRQMTRFNSFDFRQILSRSD